MRAVVQRVTEGSVTINNPMYYAEIRKGMVILLGIKEGDTEEDLNFVADKCSNLRIFEDENEKMNLSVKDINGNVLVISQFTLYGDARKGNRPSFTDAALPEVAEVMYEKFVQRMEINLGEDKVKHGVFGGMMLIKIFNDGPVTIIVESKK
ncbi:D-tyrosyl-tRNA(Tyr) deacylase [bacterium]|nr:D-tyrosyl-tRNA(Tyr) deacylase [bacterium]